MKSLLLAVLVSFSLVSYAGVSQASQDVVFAKKGKSEPAPKDRDERKGGNEDVDPRQETYEGNDRDGGSFDGGGYEGDSGEGGMIGEIFYAPGSAHQPVTTTSKKEDRGDVIVYTIITRQAVSPTELCTTTTVTTVHKATEKVVSSDTDTYCINF
ncbi:hypothetical protein [Bdellovibrio sp. HCB-162]|uniref:hypothetical protein n=1 Tax=Bdellovibrio sp. HCB-162 TaxID=3394234 RepID=UPI0039BD3230